MIQPTEWHQTNKDSSLIPPRKCVQDVYIGNQKKKKKAY